MTIDPRLAYYDIYIYQHDGTRVMLLTRYEYLEYTQRISDSWNHIIRLRYGPEDDDLAFFRNTLVRDYIFEIYRTDPVTDVRTLVYEGFHRTLVDQITQNGEVILTLYGQGYTSLLKRRIIIPAAGNDTSDKTGVAGTAMQAYVTDQCISPTDATRIVTGLTNDGSSNVGATATYSARYTILYTALDNLAQQGAVDFGVVKNTTVGTFLFKVRTLWGTDRRVGNSGGNPPTIFDVSLNNMLIPILSKKGTDEVNHVYVGGTGQGANRVIQEEKNAAAEAVSPWNRAEAFVDARNETTANGLTTRGQAYLANNEATNELTFNIQQTFGSRWIRDYNLGDIITAIYGAFTFTKKINKISVVVSSGTTGQAIIEVISAEFQDL